jgi:hypothetical protein
MDDVIAKPVVTNYLTKTSTVTDLVLQIKCEAVASINPLLVCAHSCE